MPYIVLTEEQARILEQAAGPVEARDSAGRPVAHVLTLSPEDAELIARSRGSQAAGGTPIPSAQVRAHLQRLEEVARCEELDEGRALELLRQMRDEEP